MYWRAILSKMATVWQTSTSGSQQQWSDSFFYQVQSVQVFHSCTDVRCELCFPVSIKVVSVKINRGWSVFVHAGSVHATEDMPKWQALFAAAFIMLFSPMAITSRPACWSSSEQMNEFINVIYIYIFWLCLSLSSLWCEIEGKEVQAIQGGVEERRVEDNRAFGKDRNEIKRSRSPSITVINSVIQHLHHANFLPFFTEGTFVLNTFCRDVYFKYLVLRGTVVENIWNQLMTWLKEVHSITRSVS